MQPKVEIDPLFIENYGHNFEHGWEVFTEDQCRFGLNIMNNIYNPMIVDGWEFFQQKYFLPPNCEVHLAYLGGKNFKFLSFNELEDMHQIPRFHSRSLIANETKYFDIQLMKSDITKSRLVCLYSNICINIVLHNFDSNYYV